MDSISKSSSSILISSSSDDFRFGGLASLDFDFLWVGFTSFGSGVVSQDLIFYKFN